MATAGVEIGGALGAQNQAQSTHEWAGEETPIIHKTTSRSEGTLSEGNCTYRQVQPLDTG